MSTISYQPHIDGLRAIAVLSVLIFHGFPQLLPGGYVGVDVFFVISGYLITSIIVRELDHQSFSYRDFYFRRVRRLFPALITVLLACLIAGWFVLLADELQMLGKHAAAASAFVANFVFWQEAGYFDIQSDHKILLHLWSLGVEEQFYLLWPFILVIAHRAGQLKLTVTALTGISFLLNALLIWKYPVASFYLPVTRFWELGIGGLLALESLGPSARYSFSIQVKRVLVFLAVIGLLASIYFYHRDLSFPGFYALVPTLAAAILISYGPAAQSMHRFLSAKHLVSLGLISYPLYLWHWPLLVFYKTIQLGKASALEVLLILAVAFLLAVVTHRWIEGPLKKRPLVKVVKILIVLMTIIFVLGMYTVAREGFSFRKYSQYDNDLRWNDWVQKDCKQAYGIEPCIGEVGTPQIFLIGDSHGNHLYPGLKKIWPGAVMNIGSCIPIASDLLLKNPSLAEFGNKNECVQAGVFEKQFAFIKANRPQYVVIGTTWWFASQMLGSDKLTPTEKERVAQLKQALLLTIERIEALGSKVVLVEAIPQNHRLPRDYCGLRQRVEPQSCTIPNDASTQGYSWALIHDLKRQNPNIIAVPTQDLFCVDGACRLIDAGTLLYRDEWHLSYSGSDRVAQRIIERIESAKIKTGN